MLPKYENTGDNIVVKIEEDIHHRFPAQIPICGFVDTALGVVISLPPQCELVMILSPSANELSVVRHVISLEHHSYPIIVDETGFFERLNPGLPSDNRFHSFLDKDNKPLIIGDPVNYPSVLRLIRKTIYNETN